MAYSKSIYTSALFRLERIRNKNIRECELRRKAFRSKFLEGAKVADRIAKTSICIAKAVISGGNVKNKLNELRETNKKLRKDLSIILKNAGLPEDYLRVRYDCAVCSDTGYVSGNMCECFKRILRSETYNSLCRLSPLSLCSFSTFNLGYYDAHAKADPNKPGSVTVREKMQKIYNYCVKYAENFSTSSGNIIMVGLPGLGKTHLSLSIANKVIEKGFGVIYVSVPNIMAKLEKEKYRYNNEENTETHLTECDLLILDDLGTEFRTQFTNSAIYNIINSRLLYTRPTIISTNYYMDSIEKEYSKRLVSRLWGNYYLLNFCGDDVRVKKVRETF